MSPNSNTSFQQSLLASLIAGPTTDLIFYPLDTLKVRLQSTQGLTGSGGFKGLFKGVGSVLGGSGLGAAAFFTTYESLKKELPRRSEWLRQNEVGSHLLASGGAECVSIVFRLPIEIIKTHAQTNKYGPNTTLRLAFRKVLQTQGVRGFWKGYLSTLGRDIPFTLAQFPLYENLKSRFSRTAKTDQERARYSAIAGGLSGGVASLVTQPVDVVRTRILLESKDLKSDPLTSLQQQSLWKRIIKLKQEEGIKALYKGTLPRTGAVMVAGGIYLGLYEAAKGWVRAMGIE